MYRVIRRSSFIPFLAILFVGVVLSYLAPTFFPNSHIELPMAALFFGEIAVALIFSVLLFENATPADLIKLAALVICVCMLDGAFCNFFGQGTTMMPDMTLQLNPIQLLVWNATGVLSILALFTVESEEQQMVRRGAARQRKEEQAARQREEMAAQQKAEPPAADSAVGAAKMDFNPQLESGQAQPAESAKDILQQLDIHRINKLEKSLTTQQEKVSLESLFAEETKAASRAKPKDSPFFQAPIEPEAADEADTRQQDDLEPPAEETGPIITPPAASAASESKDETPGELEGGLPGIAEEPGSVPKLFGDVSKDIDDIFSGIASMDAQKEFAPKKTSGKADSAPPVEAPPPPPPKQPQGSGVGPKLTESGSQAATAVKEFGKLSAAAAQVPPGQTTGTLKTIGQMLLDTQAVERIIRQADKQESGSKWRVVTVDRGADLQTIMNELTTFKDVEGALLIGKDGLILAATETLSSMKYVFGPLSLAIHSTTNLGTTKLQIGELRQAVMRSGDHVTIITDVGTALLGVFAKWDPARINRLIDFIAETTGSEPVTGDSDSADDIELPAAPPAEAKQGDAAPPVSPAPGHPEKSREDDITSDLFKTDAEPKALAGKEVSAPPPAAGEEKKLSSLADISDSDMSNLFDGLLAQSSPDKADSADLRETATPEAKIFNVSDTELSGLFDDLLSDDSRDKAKEAHSLDFSPKSESQALPRQEAKTQRQPESEMDELFKPTSPAEPATAKAASEPSLSSSSQSATKEEQPAEDAKVETPAEARAPEPAAADAVKEKAPAAEIKEFGKLSASALAKPDPGTESGAMKAIGKQLIDVQAVENIIKAGEKRERSGGLTTARVISAARGEGIKTLLSKIDSYEGVVGSLIVGHDGLVIASTLKGGMDKDMLGAMCTAIHSQLDTASKKIEQGKLQQSVFVGSGDRVTVITAVAVGILAVFVDDCQVPKLDGLLEAIQTTVRG